MMNALRLARVKAVVATLYVAAMLAFGFAHAPLPAPTPAQAALAWLAAGRVRLEGGRAMVTAGGAEGALANPLP